SATTLTTARLIGIAAPSTLAPGKPFTLTLLTENYIQTVADVAVAWGYSAPPGHIYSLGSPSASAYLGPEKSNQLNNVSISTTAPAELANFGGEVVLSAAVFSLYGVSSGPSVANFNVTVKVGGETS
ncbi:hypothetical protein EJ04DRAFT_401703, partial [Polyplosphaeria fusca]